MKKNVQLAYQTLDYIRDHPEEWNQHEFVCGTTACYAGRAVLISLELSSEDQLRDWQNRSHHLDTELVARRALGWTQAEAHHVFYNFTRDFAVLEQAVKEVLNGDIQP